MNSAALFVLYDESAEGVERKCVSWVGVAVGQAVNDALRKIPAENLQGKASI